MFELSDRKALARELLSEGRDAYDEATELDPSALAAAPAFAADLGLQFPPGTAPVPQPIEPRPSNTAPLPKADVVVITWTVAENDGLADVLTPGFGRRQWYYYRRHFDDMYASQIREGAPADKSRRLASYFPTRIKNQRVLCMKSELHLNQDGKPLNADGTPGTGKTGFATLPVKDLFRQIIEETEAKLIITTGTAGGVFVDHDLGDVVLTRGAKFRLQDEFAKEPFNAFDKPGPQFTSDWDVPTTMFTPARKLMEQFAKNLAEPAFAPPTKRYPFPGPPIEAPKNVPDIKLDGSGDLPKFHPMLTTDFFEFGTSSNGLEQEGSAVEMGDAVLAMVCEEMADPPKWLIARNLSDPQINGDLPRTPKSRDMQALWAVWYYEKYGYWTSVNGALACWAVIAGL
jgi:nucleoside phosphorylase